MKRFCQLWLWVWVGCVLSAFAGRVSAEDIVEGVIEQYGVGGTIHEGYWTPVKVRLTLDKNAHAQDVTVVWSVPDVDGDTVSSQRQISLSPGVPTTLWMYAPLGWNVSLDTSHVRMEIRASEAEGELLGKVESSLPHVKRVDGDTELILILGNSASGLDVFSGIDRDGRVINLDRHSLVWPIRGLSAEGLPDKWWGLQSAQTLIWTPNGGDPQKMPEAQARALVDWVHRGGHLVILLKPGVARSFWQSDVSSLMPVAVDELTESNMTTPSSFLVEQTVSGLGFSPSALERSLVSVPLRGSKGEALAIYGRSGMGGVTLCGMDLSDPSLRRVAGKDGMARTWQSLLGWTVAGRVPDARFDSKLPSEDRFRPAGRSSRSDSLSDCLIYSHDLSVTTGIVVMLALIVFAGYFVCSGPVLWVYLKKRGLQRKNWLVFMGAVIVFSVISWGGATLLSPVDSRLGHLSVLDTFEGESKQRVRSWMLVYVPKHGSVSLELPAADNTMDDQSWLACMGRPEVDNNVFDNIQSYPVWCERLGEPLNYPVRKAEKEWRLDHYGETGIAAPISTRVIRAANGPVLEISNNSKYPLKDLKVVLNHGGEYWMMSDKAALGAGKKRQVPLDWNQSQAGSTASWRYLVKEPVPMKSIEKGRDYASRRNIRSEGYLGALLASHVRQGVSMGSWKWSDAMFAASCYELLPRPQIEPVNRTFGSHENVDPLGHTGFEGIDLSSHIRSGVVWVMGTLEQSQLPVEMRVDGDLLQGEGRTFVRHGMYFSAAPSGE